MNLHRLTTLLTGCREIALDVTRQADAFTDDARSFFAAWMTAWSRRLIIEQALNAVRSELAVSARRTASHRGRRFAFPPRSWSLDAGTTKSDLEQALLSIDIFPRAAVLLLVFEGVPLKDAAVLLNAEPSLVLKAQAHGLRELTAPRRKSHITTTEWQHA